MTTFTALTTLKGRDRAEALGEAMESLDPEPTGVGVFEIEDGSGLWEVGGYFTETPDPIGLSLLSATFGAGEFVVSELPETDWVAKVRRELAPVEAGRFFVYGSHDADRVPEGSIALLIEAAMAFGTGHHGTTLGCLRALDRLVDAGLTPGRVLDLGCGTAVLAMAAARVWPGAQVLASDIDPVAVEVAEANLAANGMAGAVECHEAAGLDHPALAAAAPFDLVFANILKGPLIMLAPEIAAATAPGGTVILSGILTPQADEVIAVYRDAGFALDDRTDIVDWTTLTLTRAAEK
ncbi:50S ribosomal protein L11 methyltransferase [Psychromarinibacter sp. C21-152]|uniref:Ribosomal protein L11 methyltransferase n=1 Tax=Psychromarinibacter sediminicola TaxID=3033385 RepID=A0AAE3NRW3_9RHOB|nr:50S ribosomal protein L11 methyltransferase [Psychromarinibacter sediminicola]MDF0599820.1 50S ribosomal protein L11 methyltransferase [Psychromarinibacter sediminicola]